MTILLTALALFSSMTIGHPKRGAEFYVKIKPSVPVETLAAAVRPIGKVLTRERGSSIYLIQLNPSRDEEQARQRLAKIPGVEPLDADEQPVDMNSISSLDRKIEALKRDEERERKHRDPKAAKTTKEKEEDEKVDYLRAHRYFISQRAGSDDSFSWDAFEKGRQHVARMKPATLRGGGLGFQPMSSNTWTFIGPTNMSVPYNPYYGVGAINGRVNAVAFDPTNSQTIYAGGAQGGLWRSKDSGATWTWLSGSWTQLAVNCIAVDPKNANTIYVGRGDYHGQIVGSYGIMKSTDGGTTWKEIAIAAMGNVGVNHILIDPTNSQTLIAGTGDVDTFSGWMYRSTDGGSTWTKVALGGQYYIWPTIAASAPSGGTTRFYSVAAGYATGGNQTQRLYKSDDHGATWQLLNSPVLADGSYRFAYEVATSPTNPNNVYVLDSEHQALYTSSDQGGSWNDKSGNLPTGNDVGSNYNFSQSWYDYHLECGSWVQSGGTTDVLFLGEIDITQSTDGGDSWVSIGGPTYDQNGHAIAHNDQHCLAVSPSNPNVAVFSNDGGVYGVSFNSTTFAPTVTDLNKTLGNTMFYHIAMHPANPDIALGGAQDNASPASTGDTQNWISVAGGDGGGVAVNQTNPLFQYATIYDLTIINTTDGWQSENQIGGWGSPFSGNAPFICAMGIDTLSPNFVYTGSNFVYQWNETTQQWAGPLGNQDITNGGNGAILQCITVAPSDSNRIYTGSSDGAIWMTANQGSSWVQLNANGNGNLPKQALTSISVDPTNPKDIVLGFGGAGKGTGHFYRCSDTTANPAVFTKLSGSGSNSLPDVSLNAIARDLTHPSTTWFVGTDVGVFETTDSGTTWSNAGSPLGLPNVIVDDLVAVPGTGYLNAGTYGRGLWRLQIASVNNPSLSTFTISPTTVSAGSTSTGTVTLSAAAPVGGVVVTLASATTTVATVPTSVTVPAGATSATFTINTNAALASNGSSVLSATYNGTTLNQTISVTVLSLSSLTLSPTTVVGGNSSTGTVTISGNAPAGGTKVSLASNAPSAIVPTSVTVPSGSSSTTFTVATTAVSATTTATITGSLGSSQQTANLTINPAALTGISVSPSSVLGGNTASATVSLNGQAPSSGLVINLSSDNASATLPSTVTVSAGATSASVTVNTTAVGVNTTANLTAKQGTLTQMTALTITSAQLSTLTVSPSSLIGGLTSTGTITLNGAAPSGGTVVSLSSSTLSATLPATVTVAAGATSATFVINTIGVSTTTSATITATLGSTSKTSTLTINPALLTSVSLAPTSVTGGNTSVGTVTLNGAAGPAGAVITVTSNSTSATAPATVTVPAGATSTTFNITTTAVATTTSATITASLNSVNKTAVLTITPAALQSLAIAPSSVIGGAPSTGTLTLSGPAPAGGLVVSLSSNAAAAVVPTSATVPAGALSVTFTISTKSVSVSTIATIIGSQGSVAKSASLTVNPASVTAVSISPNSVVGGTATTGTVTLNGAAPANGTTVTLTSNSSSAVPPANVVFPAGATTATFTISTSQVTNTVSATITATLNNSTATAQLSVLSPLLSTVSVSPTSVVGGNPSTGSINLSRPAPAGGVVVNLSAGTGATVPATVVVAAGATTATFTIATSGQASTITSTITAVLDSTVTTSLTITPASLVSVSVDPSPVTGGVTATGTITLNGQAPVGGLTVTLKSSSTNATVPGSVQIAAGSTSATFAVATKSVTASVTATITATLGVNSQTTTLVIQPTTLTGVTLNPTSVIGGSSTNVSGTVTLSGPAPTGGITVTLKSSNPKVATVLSSIKVQSGSSSAVFAVTHLLVGSTQNVTITVTVGSNSRSAVLTVNPFLVTGIRLNPTSVIGGNKVVGNVTLNATPSSKSGAVLVKLASNSKFAVVPATASVGVGLSTGIFNVTTTSVPTSTQATISATLGTSSMQAGLTIQAPTLVSVTVSPTSVKGSATTAVTGTVTLSGVAPTGGLVITLSSSNSNAAATPATVTIPAGKATGTFKITHKAVTQQTAVTITASLSGVTTTSTLSVTP